MVNDNEIEIEITNPWAKLVIIVLLAALGAWFLYRYADAMASRYYSFEGRVVEVGTDSRFDNPWMWRYIVVEDESGRRSRKYVSLESQPLLKKGDYVEKAEGFDAPLRVRGRLSPQEMLEKARRELGQAGP